METDSYSLFSSPVVFQVALHGAFIVATFAMNVLAALDSCVRIETAADGRRRLLMTVK